MSQALSRARTGRVARNLVAISLVIFSMDACTSSSNDVPRAPPLDQDASPLSDAETSSDASPPVEVATPMGPAGGTLEVGGVRVEIPPGALAEPRTLTLGVTPTRIDLAPPTTFVHPVRVILSPDFVAKRTLVAFHKGSVEGEFEPVAPDDTGGGTFPALVFKSWILKPVFDAKACDAFAEDTSWPTPYERAALKTDPITWWQSEHSRWEFVNGSWSFSAGCLVDIRKSLEHVALAPLETIVGPVVSPEDGRCSNRSKGFGRPPRARTENFFMSPEAASALHRAMKYTHKRFKRQYEIRVRDALDTSGTPEPDCLGVHETDSLHNYGAAIDVSLCKVSDCDHCGENCQGPCTDDPDRLGDLAEIMVQAGFDWVWVDSNTKQVHASIASPVCGITALPGLPSPSFKCDPPDECDQEEMDCCHADMKPPVVGSCLNDQLAGCFAVGQCFDRLKVNTPRCPWTFRSKCGCVGEWFELYRKMDVCQHKNAVEHPFCGGDAGVWD